MTFSLISHIYTVSDYIKETFDIYVTSLTFQSYYWLRSLWHKYFYYLRVKCRFDMSLCLRLQEEENWETSTSFIWTSSEGETGSSAEVKWSFCSLLPSLIQNISSKSFFVFIDSNSSVCYEFKVAPVYTPYDDCTIICSKRTSFFLYFSWLYVI